MRFILALATILFLTALVACATDTETMPANQLNKQETAVSSALATPTWRIQQAKRFYPDGYVSTTQTYDYDQKARLIADKEFNSSNVLVTQREYHYRPDGSIEIFTLDTDHTLLAKTIQDFRNTLLIRERLYNADSELHFTSDFRYDQRGHKIYWGISGKNTPTTVTEYLYQGDRLIRITVTDTSQNLIKRYERVYSDQGQLDREDEFDGKDNLLQQIFYKWAGKNLAREETRSATRKTQNSTIYHYDSASNPIKLEILGTKNELVEYQTQDWIELKSGNGK